MFVQLKLETLKTNALSIYLSPYNKIVLMLREITTKPCTDRAMYEMGVGKSNPTDRWICQQQCLCRQLSLFSCYFEMSETRNFYYFIYCILHIVVWVHTAEPLLTNTGFWRLDSGTHSVWKGIRILTMTMTGTLNNILTFQLPPSEKSSLYPNMRDLNPGRIYTCDLL